MDCYNILIHCFLFFNDFFILFSFKMVFVDFIFFYIKLVENLALYFFLKKKNSPIYFFKKLSLSNLFIQY